MAWAYDAGGPIAAAPVVAGDLVVVASLSGRVAALTRSGEPRWSIELGERIYASPMVRGDELFVGVDAGSFVTLSASTGARRGRLAIKGDADTSPAPTPGGGLVFAAGSALFALRADGSVAFRHRVARKIFSSPAVADDGAIVFGSQGDALHALGPDGTPRFTVAVGADADASPAIGDDGTIYAGTDAGEVWAIGADGVVRWRAQLGGFVRGPLGVARSGRVLASTYGPAPAVFALDPRDGLTRWRFGVRGTGAREFGVHGAPLEDAAGSLIFGAQDDHVYALDGEGNLRWRLALGGDVDATLALADDGELYAGCEDGKLYALRD